MNATEAYGELRSFGPPVIETREAAALLRTSLSNGSHLLRKMADAGLVKKIRQGLWALDPTSDPYVLVPYLTSPYPAYVSLWTALAHHDMIEQIPARVYAASLDRTQQISTGFGSYSIHHLAPEVFGGYEGDLETGYLATAEKSLFDVVYIRAARGHGIRFPELTLPEGFRVGELEAWAARIPAARMRTIVTRGIAHVVSVAAR